ncbi:hypothetical protein HK098_007579 [Nowakowskiella sp. JEL0407]|nr:hypothetical protein HK098_007579 [Nowakowskiella sp. JEL0407]
MPPVNGHPKKSLYYQRSPQKPKLSDFVLNEKPTSTEKKVQPPEARKILIVPGGHSEKLLPSANYDVGGSTAENSSVAVPITTDQPNSQVTEITPLKVVKTESATLEDAIATPERPLAKFVPIKSAMKVVGLKVTKPERMVSFNSIISSEETWSSTDYDRKSVAMSTMTIEDMIELRTMRLETALQAFVEAGIQLPANLYNLPFTLPAASNLKIDPFSKFRGNGLANYSSATLPSNYFNNHYYAQTSWADGFPRDWNHDIFYSRDSPNQPHVNFVPNYYPYFANNPIESPIPLSWTTPPYYQPVNYETFPQY